MFWHRFRSDKHKKVLSVMIVKMSTEEREQNTTVALNCFPLSFSPEHKKKHRKCGLLCRTVSHSELRGFPPETSPPPASFTPTIYTVCQISTDSFVDQKQGKGAWKFRCGKPDGWNEAVPGSPHTFTVAHTFNASATGSRPICMLARGVSN